MQTIIRLLNILLLGLNLLLLYLFVAQRLDGAVGDMQQTEPSDFEDVLPNDKDAHLEMKEETDSLMLSFQDETGDPAIGQNNSTDRSALLQQISESSTVNERHKENATIVGNRKSENKKIIGERNSENKTVVGSTDSVAYADPSQSNRVDTDRTGLIVAEMQKMKAANDSINMALNALQKSNGLREEKLKKEIEEIQNQIYTVVASDCKFRSKPKTAQKFALSSIPVGTKFKLLKEDGGWYRLKYNGKEGWIEKGCCNR